MRNSRKLILAIDTGGTTIKYGLYWCDKNGRLEEIYVREVPTQKNYANTHVSQICGIIRMALEFAQNRGVKLNILECCPGQFKEFRGLNVIDLCYFLKIWNNDNDREELPLNKAVHFPTLYGHKFSRKEKSLIASINTRNDVKVQAEGMLPLVLPELPKLLPGESDITMFMFDGTGVGGAFLKRDHLGNFQHMNDGEIGRLRLNVRDSERVQKAFGNIDFNWLELYYWNMRESYSKKPQYILAKDGWLHTDSFLSGEGFRKLALVPKEIGTKELAGFINENRDPKKMKILLKAMGIMKAARIAELKEGIVINAAGNSQWKGQEAEAARSFANVVMAGGLINHAGKHIISTTQRYLKEWGYGHINIIQGPNIHPSRLVAEVVAKTGRAR